MVCCCWDPFLGAVCGEGLRNGINIVGKAIAFETTKNKFISTVDSITQTASKINEFNRRLDRPGEESEMFNRRITKSQNLIRDCSRIRYWNCFFLRPYYAYKIIQMEKDISRLSQTEVWKNVGEVLWTVSDINGRVHSIERIVSQTVSHGSCSVPVADGKTFGLELPLKEVKMRLLDDGVQVLVVSAPGGSGKTTLVIKLCHDQEIKDRFKNIFFLSVSKTPNIQAIIRGIFEHKGHPVPEFSTDEQAVFQLGHLLGQMGDRPILLVLDDIWSSPNDLLDKFRSQLPGHKILLTSRFVFPESYHLKPLNDEDAMNLFRSSALPSDGNSSIPEDIVKKIAIGCKGLPLALKVIGESLRGRPVESWQSLLMKWSQGSSIFDSSNAVLDCLKASLDFFDSDKKSSAKECFMDLASFPKDQRIPVTALIDMWAELHGLDGTGINAIDNIHELYSRKLVDLVVTREDASHFEGCYSEHFVSQHDLLRELAIYQSSSVPVKQRERLFVDISGTNLPGWWTELQQQPANARLLSINTDETLSSDLCNMQAPEAEVLVLNFRTKKFRLPQFMEKMNKLKVLIITYYGTSDGELSNFELLSSLPNLKRVRLERISIPLSVKKTSLQLKKLQKISLVMCKIGQAFSHNAFVISDVLPNLVEISIDYCDDLRELPNELCNIVCLKKVSITNCHKLSALPERIGNLMNMVELRLHSCTGLLKLPYSIGSLQNLSFLDISQCISLTKLPNGMGDLYNLRKLHMRGCSGLSELPVSFINLKQLKDVIGDEETALLWEHFGVDVKIPLEDVNLNWLQGLSFG